MNKSLVIVYIYLAVSLIAFLTIWVRRDLLANWSKGILSTDSLESSSGTLRIFASAVFLASLAPMVYYSFNPDSVPNARLYAIAGICGGMTFMFFVAALGVKLMKLWKEPAIPQFLAGVLSGGAALAITPVVMLTMACGIPGEC